MKSHSGAGLIAGAVAGVVMTFVMLLLAWLNVATPLVILGDRLSVFIPPGPFLSIMGRVGGYTHLKEIGVSSVIIGQIVLGALGGWFYGWKKRSLLFSLGIYFLLPLVVSIAVLWPQLGTSYPGFPIRAATIVTCLGLAVTFFVFERTLVLGFRFLVQPASAPNELEYRRRSDDARWCSAGSACWRRAEARRSCAGFISSRPLGTTARSTKAPRFRESRRTSSFIASRKT